MDPVDLNKVGSLLFVRLGKLGDLMAATWLFRLARQQAPHLKIGALVLPRVRELVAFEPSLDTAHTWRPFLLPALTCQLRGRWDLLVDLNDGASRSSALAARLFAPGRSLAFQRAGHERAFDGTVATPPAHESHVLDRLGCMATALGLRWSPKDLRPAVGLDPKADAAVARLLAARTPKKGLRIAFNLSAGHASRYWGEENWKALAQHLLHKLPKAQLLLLHTPQDRALADRVAQGIPQGRRIEPMGSSLQVFLASIKHSHLLVSPDTSAVHAAGAFKIPLVALYPEAAWNFASWAPKGCRHLALRSPHGGVGQIPFAAVKAAADQMVKGLRIS
jgi:ADP-heptose:LPS heptosyltransferase